MKTATIIVFLSLFLVGCSSNGDSNNTATSSAPLAANDPAPPTTTGGVAPMTSGAAGGMTPMTGTESVGGGGDGVGQAAKKMAKDKAANMGSGSLGQADKDDSGQ